MSKIIGVAWGRAKYENYFVQTICDCTEHYKECESIIGFGEEFTEQQAKEIAEQKAKELNVTIQKW